MLKEELRIAKSELQMANDTTRITEEFDGESLVPKRLITAIVWRIFDAVHPEKVILFGSYAYSEPTLDSDIDLLVIINNRKRSVENAMGVDKPFSPRLFGMDILVRTPKELSERLALGDYFIREIIDKGQVLYERRDHQRTRLGRQGGNGLRGGSRSRPPAQKAVV